MNLGWDFSRKFSVNEAKVKWCNGFMVARLKGTLPGCLAIKGGRIWTKTTRGQRVAKVHSSCTDRILY